MTVINEFDRSHLVADVFEAVLQLTASAAYVTQTVHDKPIGHRQDITEHDTGWPQVRHRKWRNPEHPGAVAAS